MTSTGGWTTPRRKVQLMEFITHLLIFDQMREILHLFLRELHNNCARKVSLNLKFFMYDFALDRYSIDYLNPTIIFR